MKVGISSYSFLPKLEDGSMTILDVIDYIAEIGGEHIELVPFGFTLIDNPGLIRDIVARASERKVDISNYAVLANLLDNDAPLTVEVDRLRRELDVAHALGCKTMRHDVSSFRRPPETNTILHFEQELPRMIQGCQMVADYAKELGMRTLLENHGFFVNGSDRVLRLLEQVNRENYQLLFDAGNFICVDERPESAAKKLVPYAKYIHMKDFFIRPSYRDPGSSTQFDCAGQWFSTLSGDHLRGAVVGQGDLDMHCIIRTIKQSQYDGYVSIEFEGMEDCIYGAKTGFDNFKRIWAEV